MIPRQLKSGTCDLEDDNKEYNEFVENACVYASVFFEKSIVHASELARIENRSEISGLDVANAMKYQFFHTEEITLQSLENCKQEIENYEKCQNSEEQHVENNETAEHQQRHDEFFIEEVIRCVSKFSDVEVNTITPLQRVFYNSIMKAEKRALEEEE